MNHSVTLCNYSMICDSKSISNEKTSLVASNASSKMCIPKLK